MGKITEKEIERSRPGVSHDMVRRVLGNLKKDGKITCQGRAPGATWRKKSNINDAFVKSRFCPLREHFGRT